MKKRRVAAFPASRIKAMMQEDDAVGKVKKSCYPMVSRAVELFQDELVRAAVAEATAAGSKKVSLEHLVAVVRKEERFRFLAEVVGGAGNEQAVDAAEENDEEEAEPKLKKTKS
jgi:histone H3/H4